MACDSYDSQGFFQNEKILEHLYAYEVRFSSGEANRHARIDLIDALTNSINVLAQKQKIKQAADKRLNGDLSDDQYSELISKYQTISDKLNDRLKDITGDNKQALRSMIAVPPMTLDSL